MTPPSKSKFLSDTLILASALGLTLCAAGWLFIENGQLRAELAAIPEAHRPARKLPATSATPTGNTGDNTARAASSQKSSPDANSVQPRDPLLPLPRTAQPLRVTDNGDGTFTLVDPEGSWQRIMNADELRQLGQLMDSTMTAATIKLPGGPSWSPGQAAGAPNTANHGDYTTAWASQSPDGGTEWLQMKYAKPVEIREINIHETYNPGAISKLSALMPDGTERVIWEGTMNPEQGVIERAVPVPPGIRSDQIRIELDTARVPGWNEIDAVELVGRDGTRQWAAESTASTYFGQDRGRGAIPFSEGLLLIER